MGVYLPIKDYSAMQGPAPSGFHVPSKDEWQGLKTIMDGLSLTTGDNWRINLHMPFAGGRKSSDASINKQGSQGNYWSSSPYGSGFYDSYASFLYLYSSNVHANYNGIRARGLSVRCFKNSFTAPTSTWTVINGTLGGAGIFRNQTEGLISITSNGTTGYTIQDKNLGATTVYNNGDTLTQANMGNMYQWGNNYGFLSTGTISNTSSTQVDASNYGPGNYYNSNTFITGSNDWSSVHNDNLWGATTGLKPASLKNAYIGEYRVPGVNTIAYYKFDGNLNDSSGNNHNFSGTNTTVTYGTLSGGAKYIHFPSGAWANPQSGMPYSTSSYTINFWVKKGDSNDGTFLDFQVGTSGVNYWNRIYGLDTSMWFVISRSAVTVPSLTTQWRNIVIVNDNNTSSLYVDGVLITSQQTNSYNMDIQYFGFNRPGYASSPTGRDIYYSEIIIESSKRTAQEIADYYNSTKSNYGL